MYNNSDAVTAMVRCSSVNIFYTLSRISTLQKVVNEQQLFKNEATKFLNTSSIFSVINKHYTNNYLTS
jgi:hypothetical protein